MSCTHLPQPPQAEKMPHKMELHGDLRVDPYYWLNLRDSEKVLHYLNAENSYTEAVMSDTKGLQEKLVKEMKARIQETEVSAPLKRGPYSYYFRYETGKEYAIYCRKKISSLPAQSSEEILLDGNKLSEGQKFFQLSAVKVSPNHKLVAFGVDNVGRRFYEIKIRDLSTGKFLQHTLPMTAGDFVWANDNRTLFVVQQNQETLRAERILRFDILTGNSTSVFFEKDEIFSVGISKSLSEKFIFMSTGSFDSTEVHFLDANHPHDQFHVFLPRESKHEYSLQDGGDGFYILTNWKAENFRLMHSSYQQKDKSLWREITPNDSLVFIEGLEVFKSFIAIQERFNGLSRIRIMTRKNNDLQEISFPDATYSVSLGDNAEFDSDRVRYSYESPVLPPSQFDYIVQSHQSELVKQKEIPTYDSTKYSSERVWATAKDGTKIPISLVYKKPFSRNGRASLLIYGYGSYGISMDPGFNSNAVSLLDRGFVFAIAHIRGGSEMGRAWYEAGRMMNKKNTFSDFVDCTQYLISENYVSPGSIFAMGGSAGGLLMGAVANLSGELYRGMVAQVPFVDVLTTMLDPSIPLTTAEYEQWGNPNEVAAYQYIKSYSPYDNIGTKNYPHILAMTGYHDSQVQYWEPAKWVAKLRDHKSNDNWVLLKTDMDSGHGGASGRFKRLFDRAFEYSFILKLNGQYD